MSSPADRPAKSLSRRSLPVGRSSKLDKTSGSTVDVSSGDLQTVTTPTSTGSITEAFPSGDPEAKFKRYGKWFGGGYRWHADWLQDVPRVRVRTSETRKMNEMLDLAVLNERLAGRMDAWEARSRLEYMKMRKKEWSLAYEYITQSEVTATLEVIEAAYRKVGAWV